MTKTVAAAVVAAAALAGAVLPSAHHVTRVTKIQACAAVHGGDLRVARHCRPGERRIVLQGKRGPRGAAGPAGAGGVNGTDGRVSFASFNPGGNGSNWADGPGAFASATTTTQSAGFGTNAFQATTSGANNTGVGYGAGRTVVTGYGNTALGTAAMYEAGSGAAFNVAIGLHAGRYLTGYGNTVIGTDVAGTAGSIDETVIVGHGAYAGGGGRVALGAGASADHADSVALGRNTHTTGASQVNVGPRDVEITDPSRGVVLVSPNGTRYRLTVADDGTLTTTPVQ